MILTDAARDLAGCEAGATFSSDRKLRFKLWRTWDRSMPTVAFCMLNPSTATHLVLDPTVRRCVGYAKRWGFGGLVAWWS